jgi:pimeloyl-ACP methyl ester carboxylesterase
MSTYVLVHGAWSGAHSWHKVRPLLQQAGNEVFTPSLTGLGERAHLATPEVNLSTHIQDVCNAMYYEDLTDVVLVGHSYGGMVVTGVAERMPERIKHLVYLDAFLPADGQSLWSMTSAGPRSADGDWRVPPMARPDVEATSDGAWMTARRLAHPRGCFEESVRLSVPLETREFSLTYIVATGRPEPSPVFDEAAARLRGNPRWQVREISGGHVMNWTNPEGLAQLLLELFPSTQRTPAGISV